MSWYLLDAVARSPVWAPATRLAAALEAAAAAPSKAAADGDAEARSAAYAELWRAVAAAGGDLADALADAMLYGEGTWSAVVASRPAWAGGSEQVAAALGADLRQVLSVMHRCLEVREGPTWPAPAGAEADPQRARVAELLWRGDPTSLATELRRVAGLRGAGPLARHQAIAWDGQGWRAAPARPVDPLVGVEPQLARMDANVAAFLAGRPAHAMLLYGPRGSGKSTAVRGLLGRFAEQGLRMAEVGADLPGLGKALAALGPWPFPTLLALDDLAFEEGETGYRSLRSLLEGGLRDLPPRLLVAATSNRRHLVRERLSDRPDPLDDDVHAWDTHQERLALSDRFGLLLTFPHVDRQRYLTLVGALLQGGAQLQDGTLLQGGEDTALDESTQAEAVAFAERGNGYSGRTARQFVTELRSRPTN